ncbi:transcription factor TFIIIC subunit [Saccharomycopsis crataegensis]|uniref:Transcription factor TFIIIC subunit n=1 Tax=Saccharomycopsis crataegensis TaxID=43959 RepID=A0AAV5QLW9_9ASCO|nr:transcription factor TFIIIC subunit [Saccharomycopsis crataegensis]
MVLETIYIARHGFRSNWLPGPVPEPPTGINSDNVLAPHGLDQAKELAIHVSSLEKKPEALFSSPFYRCLQTSTPIADALGLEILVENGIGEWYKPDRGIIPEPASLELLLKFFDNINTEWSSLITASNKGETEGEIFARTQQFWKRFFPKFEAEFPKIKSIMFVCHAATKIALGMSLMGYSGVRDQINFKGEKYLRSGACSLDTYTRDSAEGKWEIEVNGDTSFLSQGEEMSWHFIDKVEAGSDEDIKLRREAAEKAAHEKDSASVDQVSQEEEIEDFYVTIDVPTAELRASISSSQVPSHPSQVHQNFSLYHAPSNRETFKKYVYEGEAGSSNNNPLITATASASQYTPTSKMQITGIGTGKPLAKIDNFLFQGDWKQLVGTELVFSEKGEVIAKVNNHIELIRGELITSEQFEARKHDALAGMSLYRRALTIAREREGVAEPGIQIQGEQTGEQEGEGEGEGEEGEEGENAEEKGEINMNDEDIEMTQD